MAIKNAYSEVEPTKTMGEIQALLAENDAQRVQIEYENREPIAISFSMPIGPQEFFFKLDVNVKGLIKAMKEDSQTPNHLATTQQAKRTAWKNRLEWLQLQLAEVKTNQADIQELLMGFAVTNDGQTLFDRVKDNPRLLGN